MVSNRRCVAAWHLCQARKLPVLPLAEAKRAGSRGAMKHEVSTALYEYWLGRHRDTPVRPSLIQPADLAPLLPSLFLVEIESSDRPRFRFRFCGAAVATRYGRDLTGESFLELWDNPDRSMLKRDLRALAFRSTGLVAGVLGETIGGGVISYELLLLPLAGENDAVGAIGSMVRTGGHDEANRLRARIVAQSLRSIRFLPVAGSEYLPGYSKAAPAFPQRELGMRRRYGHLTVVTGGK